MPVKSPMATSSGSNPPFWKDELDTLLVTSKFTKPIVTYARYSGLVIIFCSYVLIFAAIFAISRPLAWGILIYLIILFGIALLSGRTQRKKWKLIKQEVAQVQGQALEKSGASIIGSCIHVAGNPKLDRDQNIVLALTPAALVIYPYDRDTPLDSISLQQITAIHTVVYDDERTPHLEAVDSAAQALQLSIKYGDFAYDCLLRSMKKVRPMDWYHAIQKARIQDGAQRI